MAHNHSLQKVHAPRPTYSTKVHNNHWQHTTQKKSELEELLATNTDQNLQNVHMLRYYDMIHSLYKKTQEDNDVKTAECKKLKADLIQHHEHSIRQRRTAVQQLTQNRNASMTPDQWTAKQVYNHLVEANIIYKELKQAANDITSVREILQGLHILLHYQFLELTESTDNIGQRLCHIQT